MIKVKFTTNANCQGSYDEAVLSEINVKTVYGFRRAYRQAISAFSYWKKQSPNYEMFLFVDGKEIDSYDVIMALSEDKEMRDDNLIQKLIGSE